MTRARDRLGPPSRRAATPAIVSAIASALGLAMAAAPARAGQTCRDEPLTAVQFADAMGLAWRVHQQLEASGASVVVLARAGQDLRRHGLRWSHLGLAYRTPPASPDAPARWRVVHKLQDCGTSHSAIHRQGLAEFFLDRPWRLEAAWVAPPPAWQARLVPVLVRDDLSTRLHLSRYSMVAHPDAGRYQQSNQWALETLAATVAPRPLADRAEARAWLRAAGWRPSVLQVTLPERLAARVGMPHVAFDDHPLADRLADRVRTTTVDSVFAWLGAVPDAGALQVAR